MNSEEFRRAGHDFVDWMADYLDGIEDYPVKPDVDPGDIYSQLPPKAPENAEPIDVIFRDFKEKILPGMTHWQSPSFHAYFPGNNSKPSILAEMLTVTMGAQCMLWATSPAATELEDRIMEWLRQMVGLKEDWVGSIQSGASDATLNAILTAREKASGFKTNDEGLADSNYRIYASEQIHSSIDKAIAIAGIGRNNLVKIEVDEAFAMKSTSLAVAVKQDLANGKKPIMIIVALGTTGSTAIDPLGEIIKIAKAYNIWVHVDAALAGTALILDNMRWLADGLEEADSFVFNPHKWMFTNFDASAYFVKDKQALIDTFSVTPEYLRTKEDEKVNNYRDWGVPLGRRFRALKLWFVIRSFGVEGLKEKISSHLEMAQWFKEQVDDEDGFEVLAPVPLNTICFRKVNEDKSLAENNRLNEELMQALNKSGEVFLTHVKLSEIFTLRMVIGQTDVEQRHVEKAWYLIKSLAKEDQGR
jgi:aromatic-L-amino-acid/L-tryptophan decarboxylase